MPRTADRQHTGRQRNEEARRAILDAAVHQFAERPAAEVTVATIAAEAGVGRQTIYRWWPTKFAILLEAMTELGRAVVAVPDSGSLAADLEAFVTATFSAVKEPTISLLRVVMGEAQRDPQVHRLMVEFTGRRRAVLREVLERAEARGEPLGPGGADLLVDQVFGVLWYRILLGNGPLTPSAARELAEALLAQTRALPWPASERTPRPGKC
ncbi:TetR/AcrR family transcriptional regulator [Glycomyces artemisiae]|uniref:TetR family transcriptional regulator n=1 Tax=Glycomyces artemisiae TaxID=1076443 RepID=A0A2T0USR1_9ACTN|nr:TetR/AcrR family transcriptional regulator [Glycomyces artemisiae]PRY60950.1 TetR family transcriptional regulator [Glycomyces artemisiae]